MIENEYIAIRELCEWIKERSVSFCGFNMLSADDLTEYIIRYTWPDIVIKN